MGMSTITMVPTMRRRIHMSRKSFVELLVVAASSFPSRERVWPRCPCSRAVVRTAEAKQLRAKAGRMRPPLRSRPGLAGARGFCSVETGSRISLEP